MNPPVIPEDAATVVLVRESPGGLEVYLTRRQDYLNFMGGYYVFPGGKVDQSDRSGQILDYCRDFGPDQARDCLAGVPEPDRAQGFFVAGVRELFEEAGVLMAERRDGGPLVLEDEGMIRRLADLRRSLQQDRITLGDVLEAEGLYLRPAELLWFAHWITPATSPRRFSTFFFVARAPDGQSVSPFADEIAEALWARPEDALARWKTGKMPMIPPTISCLDTIARYSRWEDLARDFSRPACQHPRTVFTG